MRSAIIVFIIFAAQTALSAQTGPEVGDYKGLPPNLAVAATAYDLAQFKSDRSGLEKWLADDYVQAGSDGKNRTKTEAIADALSPERKTASVAISKQVRRVWPDGAVLGGLVDARGVDHGKPFDFKGRFVDVWAKRNGRWQVIFTQIDNTK